MALSRQDLTTAENILSDIMKRHRSGQAPLDLSDAAYVLAAVGVLMADEVDSIRVAIDNAAPTPDF
jgi:hypothetical protein